MFTTPSHLPPVHGAAVARSRACFGPVPASHTLCSAADDKGDKGERAVQVYSQKRLSFLQNMDGMFIADRTAGTATEGRRWVPTAANVRFVPRGEFIAPGTRDSWALFAGNWGRKDLNIERKTAITCLTGLGDPALGHTVQGMPPAQFVCFGARTSATVHTVRHAACRNCSLQSSRAVIPAFASLPCV